jgi:hypothetical protein
MPDIDDLYSEALKEAYASATTSEVILNALEIIHPAFSVPIRVVADYIPLTARLENSAPINPGELVEFQAFTFDIVPPEVIDSGVPELQITIDNVSGEILENIELASGSLDLLEVIWRVYLSSNPEEGPQNAKPIRMIISSIDVDTTTIQARASLGDFVNKKFPNNEYDDRRFPGLITD